jgi:hypothetical protein
MKRWSIAYYLLIAAVMLGMFLTEPTFESFAFVVSFGILFFIITTQTQGMMIFDMKLQGVLTAAALIIFVISQDKIWITTFALFILDAFALVFIVKKSSVSR